MRIDDMLLGRVAAIDRLAKRWLAPRLEELGMTVAEFRIVGLLLGVDRGRSQRELADQLGVRAATLSVALSKLEDQRVVERVPDARDGRAKRVRIRGPVLKLTRVLDQLAELEALAFEGVSPADLAVTRRVLARVLDNVARLSAPATKESDHES